MRVSDDRGLSLVELVVVTALLGFVLAAVYMVIQFAYRSQDVANAQSHFTREISGPVRIMDASFSQSVPPAFGTAYDPYRVLLRMPTDYQPGKIYTHEYSATTDGRLIQRVYTVVGTTSTLVRTTDWSEHNANRSLNVPLFTYYDGSVVTSNVVAADSVVIEIATRFEGQTYRDKRRVAFRNR